MKRGNVDLNTCENGDILISALGAKLKYIGKLEETNYYDHEVEYVEMEDGSKPIGSRGTRTNDGHVFRNNRIPETDHDIVEIIRNCV